MSKRKLRETDILQSESSNDNNTIKRQRLDEDDCFEINNKRNSNKHEIPGIKASITINNTQKQFTMNLLQNLDYFTNRFSDLWMNSNQSNNNNNTETEQKSCVFNDVVFEMNSFELLLTFAQHNDAKKAATEIQTTSISDVQGFALCSDYFAVTSVNVDLLLEWYNACNHAESSMDHLEKWKHSKCKLLHELYLKIKLEFVIGEANAIKQLSVLWDKFDLSHRFLAVSDANCIFNWIKEIQLRWLWLIERNSDDKFDKMMKVMSFAQNAIDSFTNIAKDPTKAKGRIKELNYFPIIECLYFCWNCIVESNKSHVIVSEIQEKRLKQFAVKVHKMYYYQISLFTYKKEYIPQGNIEVLTLQWFDGINKKWGNQAEHLKIGAAIMKLIVWECIDRHHWPHYIRDIACWSLGCVEQFEDQVFVQSIIEKCNQNQCIQLAVLLRRANFEFSLVLAKKPKSPRFISLYSDFIEKHTGFGTPTAQTMKIPWDNKNK